MTKPQTTQPRKPAKPKAGRPISVRVDEGMADDLAVIMKTGCDASAAIRHALLILANVCDAAWAGGHYPAGVMPTITHSTLAEYRPSTPADEELADAG